MNLDTLRAKAEAAKAWRPPHLCDDLYVQPCNSFMAEVDCQHGCSYCLGAQRAVKEIEIDVSRAIGFAERGADRLANGPAFHAAMIASFFCSEPNQVSEFRDAVKEACK